MNGVGSFELVRADVRNVLATLANNCVATFFVTGEVAENCPDMIREMIRAGHEVGCHGMFHENFDTFGATEQARRITMASEHIANSSGNRPKGFRAPQHRANGATLEVLEELGYVYDSSVLPRTPFMRPETRKKWRQMKAPNHPYYPSRTDITKKGDCKVLELPTSTFVLPFVSSLTMRSNFVSDLLAKVLLVRKDPVIYYLHSYDNTLTKRKLYWLSELITNLRKKSKLITMQDLAKICGRPSESSSPSKLFHAPLSAVSHGRSYDEMNRYGTVWQ